NYSGPVEVVAVEALLHVIVRGQVPEGVQESSLELAIPADATPGHRTLRLRASALSGALRDEGALSLTIEPAAPPPPSKPSLRLENLAAVTVEAGKTKPLSVKVRRHQCPGKVQILLAEASPGVEVRNGLVESDTDEGKLELVVRSDAKAEERTLRLRAVASAA